MKKFRFLLVVLVLGLAQVACGLPAEPGMIKTSTAILSATEGPRVVTATTAPQATAAAANTATAVPTAVPTSVPTATRSSSGNDSSPPACTYLVTFIADISIPDDTIMTAGAAFTKTWRVRNDGSCTWGPNQSLHALAFTGGSRLDAVDQISLPGNVGPGQTVDLSVGMVAPAAPGTYTSEWKFKLTNPPAGLGTFLGMGGGHSQPLFTRVIVGPTPTTTPVVTTTRIEFAPGATHAQVDGQVKRGAVRSYVLTAAKGQLLMASFSSAVTDLRLQIVNARNQTVLLAADGSEGRVVLPENGDYLVQLLGGSQDANFTLGVIIPRRISFAAGESSAALDGKISNHAANFYLLRAQAGQTMTVKVSSPGNGLALTIYGMEDGQPLVRADFGLTEWTGDLNLTQDYMIMVVPAVDTATYTIQVTVH